MTISSTKIILASPPHTGSTPLLNLVHGFLMPEEPRHWCTERLIDQFMITKTHQLNLDGWEEKYPHYNLYFVMSERNDDKMSRTICEKDKKKKNVLVVDYPEMLVTPEQSLNHMIETMYEKFVNFFPKEIIPLGKNKTQIKQAMLERFTKMNQCVEEFKDKPWNICEDFYGIHGGHRNRQLDVNSYIFISGEHDEEAEKIRLNEYYGKKKELVVEKKSN